MLFETTNTMNAPSVSSVGSNNLDFILLQKCEYDLVLSVFGTSCSSACLLLVVACLVPSCCSKWHYCVVSPHLQKYQPSPSLPQLSLPLYSDVKKKYIYTQIYRYISVCIYLMGLCVCLPFWFFPPPFAAFAGWLGVGVISFCFLNCHFRSRYSMYCVCSGLARTAEPARRAGVVSILLSTYI